MTQYQTMFCFLNYGKWKIPFLCNMTMLVAMVTIDSQLQFQANVVIVKQCFCAVRYVGLSRLTDVTYESFSMLYRWSRFIQRSSRRADEPAFLPRLSQRLCLRWRHHLQVCESFPIPASPSSFLFRTSTLLAPLSFSAFPLLTLLSTGHHGEKRQTVVSGSLRFTLGQYLIGMTESAALTNCQT